MAITERQRHHLFQRLEEVLGTEEAITLMEHLPPVGWADVATTTDLEHLRVLSKADLDEAHTGLTGDIHQLRTEVTGELGVMRAELDGKLERGFREQTRTMVLANAGTMLAFGSLVLAAVKL